MCGVLDACVFSPWSLKDWRTDYLKLSNAFAEVNSPRKNPFKVAPRAWDLIVLLSRLKNPLQHRVLGCNWQVHTLMFLLCVSWHGLLTAQESELDHSHRPLHICVFQISSHLPGSDQSVHFPIYGTNCPQIPYSIRDDQVYGLNFCQMRGFFPQWRLRVPSEKL